MSAFRPAVKEQVLPHGELTLEQIRAAMGAAGATRLFAKELSPNDNSKNQIYLGGDLSILNTLPAGDPTASTTGSHGKPIFKASLDFLWLDDSGRTAPAPSAQLILYPQYPEVRMSGFLQRSSNAPSALLATRAEGRVLILGVTPDRRIIGYAAGAGSPLASEIPLLRSTDRTGVLVHVALSAGQTTDARGRLLAALGRIARKNWITGWRLLPDGTSVLCSSSNCVGVTLESELGITGNGRSEPDFEGWEIKGHTVASLTRHEVGTVTLMTPEPTGGVYTEEGVFSFVSRFGYDDKHGRADRRNFGGVHKVGEMAPATGMTLVLDGYNTETHKIERSDGALLLVDGGGTVGASWSFAGLLAHWNRKHAKAAFVPALKRTDPDVSYRYGEEVFLAEGTDYRRLFDALAAGIVYYDPGIKVESASGRPIAKKRSQFRVRRKDLRSLYHSTANQNVHG